MPIHGNASVPDVTAAHGSVVQALWSFSGVDPTGVLTLPMAGMGRCRVMFQPNFGTGTLDTYPSNVVCYVIGTGNQPSTWVDLIASPFFYQIDTFVLAATQITSGGQFRLPGANTITREYGVFTPFVTVAVTITGTIDPAVSIRATLMGITG